MIAKKYKMRDRDKTRKILGTIVLLNVLIDSQLKNANSMPKHLFMLQSTDKKANLNQNEICAALCSKKGNTNNMMEKK